MKTHRGQENIQQNLSREEVSIRISFILSQTFSGTIHLKVQSSFELQLFLAVEGLGVGFSLHAAFASQLLHGVLAYPSILGRLPLGTNGQLGDPADQRDGVSSITTSIDVVALGRALESLQILSRQIGAEDAFRNAGFAIDLDRFRLPDDLRGVT